MTATQRAASASVISLRTSSPVLVGRSRELGTLTEVVSRPPSVVMLEGEAGVGKTRLTHELLAGRALGNRWVAWGCCQPFREPFPFGPVIEALRAAAPRLPGPRRLNPVTGALRPLLAELASNLPPQPEPLGEPEAERHRVFRAFRDVLDACGPTVLVLEDLHWADEGTRDLVGFLTSHPCRSLSIVLTYRRELSALRGIRLGGAHRRAADLTHAVIRLAPLDVAGVRQLASSLLGDIAVSTDFASRLHERTAGIPFAVEETLRGLENPAAVVTADGSRAKQLLESLEVPGLLRETIGERVSTLSRDAERIVHGLAVLGVPATTPTLHAVSGLTVAEIDDALLEALRAGVIQEPTLNKYGFRHALASQAVYETIPGPHRQRLHQRAAAVLAAGEAPPLVQIASHYRAAHQTTEWLETAEAAADQAEDGGDSGLATEILQELLEDPSLDGDRMDRLATKLSKSALGAVGQCHVIDVLGRVLANERLSQHTRSKVRLHRGLLLTRQPRGLEEGRADLAAAVEELRETDPSAAVYGMSVLAKPQDGASSFAEHARWIHQVDEQLARTQEPEVIANVLANQLHALVHIGSPDAATRVARLPAHAGSKAEHRHLARAHLNLGDAYAWVGHYDQARWFLRTGRSLADDGGTPYLLSIAEATEAHIAWWTGKWSGLRERAEILLERYLDVRDVANELALVLGSLAVACGEWESAQTHLRRSGLVDYPDSSIPLVIAASATMTRMHLSREDDDLAYVEAMSGIDVLLRKGILIWGAELVPEAVQACCRTGRVVEARSLLRKFDEASKDRDAPLARAASFRCHGIVQSWYDELGSAQTYFDSARAAYAALPAPYFATLAAEQAALSRVRAGSDEAVASFAPIGESFDALGAIRDAARCRHFLRAAGAATPSKRGRRGYGEQLSPREREVARLIATGQTNRAIAEVLFLSPRTVEHHVANVLRKTGVRARADLTLAMIS